MKEKAILQVALDVLNEHRALQIAKEAIEGGADWLEAGTPLIKSEGMQIIRKLKSQFPQVPLVADMKTIDVGGIEVEMAAKSGADIIGVLGISEDATLKEAIRSARNYNAKIMVDLIRIEDKQERAKAVEKLGADFICLHVGIDEQMIGKDPLGALKAISSKLSLPVAVAGGINSETAAKAIQAGASILIVGGAIVKSAKVSKATQLIKDAMEKQVVIKTDLFKRYGTKDLRKAFLKVSTPNISDAMHRKGAIEGIRPLKKGYKLVGKALTVATLNGDWAKPVEAIDGASKGEVLVIDVNGGKQAVWGELATRSAKIKGIAGVVIDGAVRDADDIYKLDLPIFARWISPNAGEPKGYGEIGGIISCGGVRVKTGDWIIGDDSGLVRVPKEEAKEIANRALDVKERENRIREEIERGGSLGKVLRLKKWEKAERGEKSGMLH
jgi:3-hexulose-6-phosphate synthase/6-phospho-3-hexuloisomerase